MDWIKKGWRRTPGHIRKPFVFVLGFAVVLAGIALLVLPGPGWLVIFAGFAILATEFSFAERVRDGVVVKLKGFTAAGKRAWRSITGRSKTPRGRA